MKSHRHSGEAFTLVELLLVVAIIAILAALLSPALKNARDQAKSIKCTSNLKQISIGMYLYIDDFDGFFPPEVTLAEGEWNYILVKHGYLPTAMAAYVGPVRVGIFACPSESKATTAGGANWAGTNYGINMLISSGYLNQPGSLQSRLIQIQNPATTCVVGDSGGTWGYGACLSPPGCGYDPALRHSGRWNVLFADGSVRSFNVAPPYTGVVGDFWRAY